MIQSAYAAFHRYLVKEVLWFVGISFFLIDRGKCQNPGMPVLTVCAVCYVYNLYKEKDVLIEWAEDPCSCCVDLAKM